MNGLKARAYRSVLWQLSGVSFSALLSIGYMMIMGRLLEPEAFGEFALVMVVIGVTQILTQFGFGPALVYRKVLDDSHISFVFLSTILIGLATCGIVIFAAPAISQLFDMNVRVSLVQVAASSLVLSTLGTTSLSLLTRDLQFDRIFWANTLSYLFGNVFVGIALAMYGHQAWALLAGILVSQGLNSVMLLYFRSFRINLAISKPDARSIMGYGSGLLIVQVLNQVALQLDKIIVGNIASLAQLGAYERSQRIQTLPMTYLGNAIDGVVFSVLSKFSDQRHRIGEHYFPFVALVSLLAMYFAVYLFLFAEQVIRVILGDGWDDSVVLLKWLSVLVFIQVYSRFGDTLVRATREFTASTSIKLLYLATMTLSSVAGYNIGGFFGVLAAILLSHLVHSGLMTRLSLKIAGVPWHVFAQIMLPVLVFALLTLLKGIWIQTCSGLSMLQQFLALGLSDLLFLTVFITSPTLFGQLNTRFIADRLHEIPALSRLSKLYDKRIKPAI